MDKRSIGTLEVSVVGIGCNNFGARLDQDGTNAVVNTALEEGINFFDTADIYGGTKSEEMLGRALGNQRAEVIIATKFGMPIDDERFGAKPVYVKRACEDSLRRLNTTYIDLYQLHYPDDSVPHTAPSGTRSTSSRCRTSTRCSLAIQRATGSLTLATNSVSGSCPSTHSPTACSPAR